MALTATVREQDLGAQEGPLYLVPFTAVASDSYSTGGDPLSFLGLNIPSTKLISVFISSQAGSGYTYQYKLDAAPTLANGKVLTLGPVPTDATSGTVALAEIAAAAYPAAVTGDTIKGLAIFERGV